MSLAQEIIDDLNLSEFTYLELKVYLTIVRMMKSEFDIISVSLNELKDLMGNNKQSCISGIKGLCRKKFLYASYEMENNVPKKYYSLKKFKTRQLPNGIIPKKGIVKNKDDDKTLDFPGYVYLIQANLPDKPCKIGKSTNIPKRMNFFHVKLPFDFELIHTIKCRNYHYAETMMHKHYDSKRSNGEWFNLDEDDIAEIKNIKLLK